MGLRPNLSGGHLFLSILNTYFSFSHIPFVVFQAIISNYPDLMPPEFENYFCYSAMWAFGGTLVKEHRPYFSQWWKEQWNDYVMLPGDEEVSMIKWFESNISNTKDRV